MAKNLVDNFEGSKWVGPTVKLTPQDKMGTPEAFEKLYDKRRAPKATTIAPGPKLKAIPNPSFQDRLSEYGLDN